MSLAKRGGNNITMIFLGADHRGYQLKEKIKQWLVEWGLEAEDLGNKRLDPNDDFPDFAILVAEKVSQETGSKGILICGNGIGMSVAANKVHGVRCGLGFAVEQVKRGREEDDINCLALPADFVDDGQVKEIVKVFLETKFLGEEKYKRRIQKILHLAGGHSATSEVSLPL